MVQGIQLYVSGAYVWSLLVVISQVLPWISGTMQLGTHCTSIASSLCGIGSVKSGLLAMRDMLWTPWPCNMLVAQLSKGDGADGRF